MKYQQRKANIEYYTVNKYTCAKGNMNYYSEYRISIGFQFDTVFDNVSDIFVLYK